MTSLCLHYIHSFQRFDGRALLDNVPSRSHPVISEAWQDREIADELNFERYRDLVEVDRLEGINHTYAFFQCLPENPSLTFYRQ
jgi:hypothetical protein